MNPETTRRREQAVAAAAMRQKPQLQSGSRRQWGKVLSVDAGPPNTVTVEMEPGGVAIGPLRYLDTGVALLVDDYVFLQNVDGDMIVIGKLA